MISEIELRTIIKKDGSIDLDKAVPYLYDIADAVCASCKITNMMGKDDIKQEMVLTVCRRNHNIVIDIEKSIFNYLFTIFINTYRDIIRKKKRRIQAISIHELQNYKI